VGIQGHAEAAEVVEGRGLVKGNSVERNRGRTQRRVALSHDLRRTRPELGVGSMRRSRNVPLKEPDGPAVAAQKGNVSSGGSFPGPPTVLEIRRWLVPEVVQTSAMDCGPASLKCLLEGFQIPVSYGRLREACQTDVDALRST
jgi:hypothetical protein